jgi:hypothetical protein
MSLVRSTFYLAVLGLVLGVFAPRADADEGEGDGHASVLASWDCTGTPCPWGDSTTSEAAEWPAAAEPTRARHGYTVSHDVYAAAPKVAGWTITITAGTATVYAGTPNGSHAGLATLQGGQSFTVPTTLGTDDKVSVQSGSGFDYTLTPGTAPTPTTSPPPTTTASPTSTPSPTPEPTTTDCTDPTSCDPVSWVDSRWRYTGPEANPGDWYGGVITWPSWSAFSTNAREGIDGRTVYSATGKQLYPYMGAWADGCQIHVVSGGVLVIEWERGSNEWRETTLAVGDTYTIDLTGPENGAMIETPNDSEPFQVSLSSCTPQTIDKGSSE